jgi:hypothetical protein
MNFNSAVFWNTYFFSTVIGVTISGIFFLLIEFISKHFFNIKDASPIIAIIIMPLGFVGIFAQYFTNIIVPYSEITGVAILAWSFMLLKNSNKIESAT